MRPRSSPRLALPAADLAVLHQMLQVHRDGGASGVGRRASGVGRRAQDLRGERLGEAQARPVRAVGVDDGQRYGDLILLTTEDGTMSRLDPTTDTEWSVMSAYADGIRTIMPTLLGQHVIFMDAKGYACAFDLASARLLWAIKIAAEHQTRDRLPAASLAAGAIVIGTGQGGRRIVMDIDGQRLTARRMGKHILTDMTSPEAGRIAIGTPGALIGCQIV